MGSEYQLISQDGQRALEEFSQDFATALAQAPVEQWAMDHGLSKTTRALKTTYPINVHAALYAELKGDIKYRSIFAKSISLSPKTWQDGVAELASIIEAPDFGGWGEQPAAMAAAAQALPNEIIAALLEANGTQEFDGKAYFASDHPVNVFRTGGDTFDNDFTGAGTKFTAENLAIMKAGFRGLKGPNGKPLGLRMTHGLFPGAMEEEVKDVLEQDMVIQAINGGDAFGAVTNRHKNTIVPIFSDELTDDAKFYPLALNKPGLYPWIVQSEGTPEQIIQDRNSPLYVTKLMLGIAYVLRGNGALALPHCIQRWAGVAA